MQTNKFTEQEELDFISNLYDNCNEQLKEILNLHKENKEKFLKELGLILLYYKINNNVMDLSVSEKNEIKNKLEILISKFTGKQIKLTLSIITAILFKTVKDTFKFYGYKYDSEEVEKIVNHKFKGEVYTKRIKNNEEDIANYLNKNVNDFVNGAIDVNTINLVIDKTYKQNKTNVLTLAETEVNRSENEAFLTFAKYINAVKVVRNELLDSKTCSECESIHGRVYNLSNAPDLIHPNCRGFNSLYSDGVED
ncbi:hypothetical protein [Clostridium beijerinckii]|uniref:Uncharacterized protein n=1 Tax=Clostridium beijerinckii TaxID=1520 RepID=A0A1S9N9C9_CLOBE|nr:hypothetical protein [Clostridium beijerinckii]OOP74149.1 hypothetical protein CBEIBR21_06525 [Clostridium beijerinckii]